MEEKAPDTASRFTLLKFLPASDTIDMSGVSYLDMKDFSGTVYKYKKNGKLEAIEGYENGVLKAVSTDFTYTETSARLNKMEPEPCFECDDDGGGGSYVWITVTSYTDWYVSVNGGPARYQYSEYNGSHQEKVYFSGGGTSPSHTPAHEHTPRGAYPGKAVSPHPGDDIKPNDIPGSVWIKLTTAQKARWPNLRSEEKAILLKKENLWAIPIYLSNAIDATTVTAYYFFNTQTKDNGNANAFKHAYFSALNAMTLGVSLAKQLGDAHEAPPNSYWPQKMDEHNNEVGRNIGRGISTSNVLTVQRQCFEADKDGKLRRLNPAHNGLVYTNGKDE